MNAASTFCAAPSFRNDGSRQQTKKRKRKPTRAPQMMSQENITLNFIEIGVGLPQSAEMGDVVLYDELLFVEWDADSKVRLFTKDGSRDLLLLESNIDADAVLPVHVVHVRRDRQTLIINAAHIMSVSVDRVGFVVVQFNTKNRKARLLSIPCDTPSDALVVVASLISFATNTNCGGPQRAPSPSGTAVVSKYRREVVRAPPALSGVPNPVQRVLATTPRTAYARGANIAVVPPPAPCRKRVRPVLSRDDVEDIALASHARRALSFASPSATTSLLPSLLHEQ